MRDSPAINAGNDANAPATDQRGARRISGGRIDIGAFERNLPYFDFDGDLKTDISIFRPTTGNWWYQKSSNGQTSVAHFGSATDKITPGDYTGDGKFDSAVFRPTGSTWFINRSTAGTLIQNFGQSGDLPAPNAFVP